jgi:hypothetical protein
MNDFKKSVMKRIHIWCAASALGVVCLLGDPQPVKCEGAAGSPTVSPTPAHRDGSHDFDFEIGAWKIHLKKLVHPLSGSDEWVEFDGSSVTRKLWDGRANIEEFETDGKAGHIQGLTLRMYNPQSHQWSLYWGGATQGGLSLPAVVGEFKDGVGEFYDQEDYQGRMIFVRYRWSQIASNSAHFEQSFSTDGGKTWEVNWITDQVRVEP